jgi:hypothetical protein
MALKDEMRVCGLIEANLRKLPASRRFAVLDFVANSLRQDPGPEQDLPCDPRQEKLPLDAPSGPGLTLGGHDDIPFGGAAK